MNINYIVFYSLLALNIGVIIWAFCEIVAYYHFLNADKKKQIELNKLLTPYLLGMEIRNHIEEKQNA